MTSTERRIAFKLELPRMLELLADQIYQSPLALLRENTQKRVRCDPDAAGDAGRGLRSCYSCHGG